MCSIFKKRLLLFHSLSTTTRRTTINRNDFLFFKADCKCVFLSYRMTVGKMKALLCTWLIILSASSESSKIGFYDEPNYKGLMYEASPNSGCNNIPEYANDHIASVKTPYCIMAYEDPSCKGYSIKITSDGKEIGTNGLDLNRISMGSFHTKISSFQLCTNEEGGEQINVDIYREPWYKNISAQYTNVCGCIELPGYLWGKVGSIDNHGNCIRIYPDATNCSGEVRRDLRAGSYFASANPHVIHMEHKSRWYSFRIHATITGFKITTKTFPFRSRDIDGASKIPILNTRSATITKEFSETREYTESFQISKSEAFSNMDSISIETSFQASTVFSAETSLSIGKLFPSADTKIGFEQSLWSSLSKANHSQTKTVEKSRSFSTSQSFEISPCTEYSISSFLKIMENIPFDYEITLLISGLVGSQPMTSAKLRNHNSGFTFLSNHGNSAIKAKGIGNVIATFGLEVVIDGSGKHIPGCGIQSTTRTTPTKPAITANNIIDALANWMKMKINNSSSSGITKPLWIFIPIILFNFL